MDSILIDFLNFFQTYSPIHSNILGLLISCLITNYLIIHFIYHITSKKYNRFVLFALILPIFVALKLSFGTTLFANFSIHILDMICYSLFFVIIFLCELAYLNLSHSSYHEAIQIFKTENPLYLNSTLKNNLSYQQKISPLLDAYIIVTLLFTLNFASFYPLIR